MESGRIHVFSASFHRRDEALAYSQEQWEPEPGEDASDEEYEAWEGRNPSWRMRDEIGIVHLDSDLIETVWGTGNGDPSIDWEYLASIIGGPNASACEHISPPGATTLILISESALGGSSFEFASTPTMAYCGVYPSRS